MKKLLLIVCCLFLFGCGNSNIDNQKEYKNYNFVVNYLYEENFIEVINDVDDFDLIKQVRDGQILPDEINNLINSYNSEFFIENSLITIYLGSGGNIEEKFDKIVIDDYINVYINNYGTEYISAVVSGNLIFVEIPNSELLDKEILVHQVEQGYMVSITPYCYFTRTVKLNDIILDDEYGVTFYHFEVPNTGEIVEVMVKNPIVVDVYKDIKFEKGKYYDFIFDNKDASHVQFNDTLNLIEGWEPYKVVLSEDIKNEPVCETNKLYIKERIITNEDYSFMFYEDDNYKYYFKNYCPNILIIDDNEYTFAEVIENGYLTFDDIDRMGYEYNKIEKKEAK